MPYKNEIAARIEEPSKFKQFHRQNDKFGQDIDVIWGTTDSGATEIQAIRFKTSKFDIEQVKAWLKAHDIKAIKVEGAENEAQATHDAIDGEYSIRFDAVAPTKTWRTDEGYLMCEAPVAKVGVLTYRNPDGSTRKEFCPPDEIFNQDSISTLKMKPVTNGHPPRSNNNGILTPATVSKYASGSVGENFRQDENKLFASLAIHNKAAISAVENGTRELSPGYMCFTVRQDGEYKGEKYDYIQTNRRYNHVAIVPAGRAGKDLSINMDSEDTFDNSDFNTTGGNAMLVKFNIDGADHEIPKQVENHISRLSARADVAESQLTAAREGETKAKDELKAAIARADAAEADLKKTGGLAVGARVALARQVQEIVGQSVNMDSCDFDPIALKKIAIKERMGAKCANLDEKDEAYINAAFDLVVALDAEEKSEGSKRSNAAAALGDGSGKKRKAKLKEEEEEEEEEPKDAAESREKMKRDATEQWRKNKEKE